MGKIPLKLLEESTKTAGPNWIKAAGIRQGWKYLGNDVQRRAKLNAHGHDDNYHEIKVPSDERDV